MTSPSCPRRRHGRRSGRLPQRGLPVDRAGPPLTLPASTAQPCWQYAPTGSLACERIVTISALWRPTRRLSEPQGRANSRPPTDPTSGYGTGRIQTIAKASSR